MGNKKRPLPLTRPGPYEEIGEFFERFFGGNPAQKAYLKDRSREKAAVAGLGSGKTLVAAYETIVYAHLWRGIKQLVVAPTFPMMNRSTKLTILQALTWWPAGDLEWEHNKSEQYIRFPKAVNEYGEASVIYFGHATNPEMLRAIEVGRAWIDEAALVSRNTYLITIGRLRQPGMPNVFTLTTTPKGMDWIYERYAKERDTWTEEARAEYGFHTWATYANPLYEAEPGYIKSLNSAYVVGSDLYRQEVEASFIALKGQVYNEFDAAKHVKQPFHNKWLRTAYGVDWGVASPGCILVFKQAPDGVWWLMDEVYTAGKYVFTGNKDDWVTAAKELIKEHGPGIFYCDPANADAIGTFRTQGINAVEANNKRVPGVGVVKSLLASGKLMVKGVLDKVSGDHIPLAPHTVKEFGQYHWREDRDGEPLLDQDPAKEFDHAMDALRYAMMGVAYTGESKPEDTSTVKGEWDNVPGEW